MPRLKLQRPAESRLSIAKKPALPPARVTMVPAPKATRVAPPPQKAVPVARPAAPAAPKDIARPAQKPAPVAKPAQTARQTPAVTPPPAPMKVAPPPPAVVKPAPVVPATPKAAPSPAPMKQKVASLPPKAMANIPGLALRVGFSGNSTRISAQEKSRLDGFADKIAGSGDRLQLKSFAGASGETASASRRRSLSRALAVRSYLIEKGVRSTRIDVRALGMAADSGPTDRVDVIILVR